MGFSTRHIGRKDSVYAPKCGIDNEPASIYFAPRRRLKGLAQIKI